MKRMCKFIFGIIFSIFMMGIISCSGQDESTNLTIAIDMSGLLPSNESKDSFARNVDDEKWKLEVTLIDLEDENNILPLTISVPIIDNKASVTFEKIPLFFKGRIEAIIFEGETPKFTGKSEEFIVHEGRNRISVHMEEVDNPGAPVDPEDPTEPENPTEPDDPTESGDPEDPADPDDPNQPGDGTGDDSGETGGDDPTEPGNPEDPADPNDPNQPGDGTGEGSGDTGGDEPTEPGNPGDDPEIGETEKTAKYTVKHYQQNAEDDEYTLVETDTEEKTGIVGAETSAEAKEYEGFEVYSVEQKTIAEDGTTEVQIKYNRKVITLTFDTKGGSDVNAIEGKYGAKITDSIVTTKTGYVFVAWDETLPETFPATDTKYTATWTPITYTVVFNPGVDDGSVNGEMNSLPCTYDVPNVLPKNEFTRENFDFNGWKDASGTEYKDCVSVENLSSTQNAVVTLYAQWHPQSKVRDVDFSVAGGDVNYGTKVTLSCETEGATIYYKEGNAEDFSEYNGEIEIKNDVTITAYAAKEGMVAAEQITKTYTLKKYTVTLNYNNETEETTVEVTSGSQYTLPTEVTRTGYTFDGWELNGAIVEEQTITVTDSDITLTAKWTPITYEITYDLVANDVKNPNTVTKYTIESETIVLQSPTRTGYSFEGWKNTAGEIVTQITKGSIGIVSLTAQWKKIEYELTITIPSYSDLNEFKITENNSTLSVEIPDGYTIERWYVNGQEIDSPKNNEGNEITEGITSNQLGIEEGGIYTIMIIVKETNGTKLYSAECQLEVTK